MPTFNWQELLTQSNQELFAEEEIRAALPPEVLASGWLGFPRATEEQLTHLEARLGTTLPPSYRAFLTFTNGWRATGHFIPALWSTEEVEWFAVRNQETIDIWRAPSEDYPDVEPIEIDTALEISDQEYGGSAVYLLNPQVVTPEGEWEAWFFASWIPGERRFDSFRELMQQEHEGFLDLREFRRTSRS